MSAARAPRRILVGDSHASGLAAAAERAGVPFVAWTAYSGQRTRTIADSEWVDRNAPTARADEVWIVSSGNDRHADNLEPSARSLLSQAGGRRVVWLGPPVALVPLVDDEHAHTTEKLAELLGPDVFIDSRRFTRSGHAPDGVHFTAAGYDAWWVGASSAADAMRWQRHLPLAVGVGLGALGLLAAALAVWQNR